MIGGGRRGGGTVFCSTPADKPPPVMSHFDRSRSKASAPSNICLNVVTLLVSQSSGWSKASASRNVSLIIVTALVSQTSSELKAAAPQNVHCIDFTLLVSQAPIASLNVEAPSKSRSSVMSSTRDTSQPEIGPCVASAVVTSATAAFREAPSMKTPGGVVQAYPA